MAAITIEQIGDWVLADDGWLCKYKWADYRGQVEGQPVLTPRAGASPSLEQGSISARTMPVTFVWNGTVAPDTSTALETLAGKLSIDDPTPRRIVGTAFDKTTRIQTTASIGLSSGWDDSQSMNTVLGVLVAGQSRWEATSNDTAVATFADIGQYPAMAIPNAGYATVDPTVTIQPTVTAHSSTSTTVGWQYRKQISFTNVGPNTWDRPLRLDCGATDALVTAAKMQADCDDLRIQLNGIELARTLIAPNWAQTYAWVEPPPIAPGETVIFEMIYGNPSAANPAVLTGKLHPSIIYEYATGTATSGSTTTMVDTTKTWLLTDINWVGAYITMLSGTNAGLTREITAYTTNSVTTVAFPGANAATNKYLITHSTNTRWWYNVQQWFDASAGTPVRGLWYLDKRTRQPSDVDFDVPASWRPYAMYDNQDRFAQKSVSLVSGKYYAFLDAYRSWQGGGPKGQLTSEDGIADGVAFHSSIPILGTQVSFGLSNNLNGMCQGVVMAKASGAEDWETITSLSTASTSAVYLGGTSAGSYLTLPTPDQYFFLYRGLLPSDTEGVIRPDRARDTGSTTSDGSTRNINAAAAGGPFAYKVDPSSGSASVQDSTPANVTIPNGQLLELDGRNSGSWRGVLYTDGSGNQYKGWIALANLNAGTTTGGDTLVDGSKNWVVNSLTGAQVKITGSGNSNLVGKVHTVASNTATTITVTAGYGATVPQGTTYETIQPKTTVTLQDGLYSWVDFDGSFFTMGATGAEQAVYQLAAELAVGDGGPALFERKVSTRIGLDGVRVFLRTTDSLVLDCKNRKANILDNTGAVVAALTDPAVLAQQVTQDPVNHRKITKRSARWLPIVMGGNRVTDGGAETGVLNFYNIILGAGWTIATPAIDTTTPLVGAKSHFATVSASGLINTFSVVATLDAFKSQPGQRVQFSAGLRTTNTNLRPSLGVLWLDNVSNVVAATYGPAWTPVANTYYRCGYSAINPDLSNPNIAWTDGQVSAATGSGAIVYGQPVIKITAFAGGATGTIRWDEFDFGSPILWYSEAGGTGLTITTTFPKGYLG